jgi:hypothetical protein
MDNGLLGSTLLGVEQVRRALLPSGWRGKPLPKTTRVGRLSLLPSATFEIPALRESLACCLSCANTECSIITIDPLAKSS